MFAVTQQPKTPLKPFFEIDSAIKLIGIEFLTLWALLHGLKGLHIGFMSLWLSTAEEVVVALTSYCRWMALIRLVRDGAPTLPSNNPDIDTQSFEAEKFRTFRALEKELNPLPV